MGRKRLELPPTWNRSTDRQPPERVIGISFCSGTMAPLGEAGNGGNKERILALIFFYTCVFEKFVKTGRKRRNSGKLAPPPSIKTASVGKY